jgi:hypothetical protein
MILVASGFFNFDHFLTSILILSVQIIYSLDHANLPQSFFLLDHTKVLLVQLNS